MTKNNNREKRIRKMKNKTQQFTWFSLEPISTGEDEKELSLLLKEITTLQVLISQSPNLYLKRDLLFWSKNLFLHFFF